MSELSSGEVAVDGSAWANGDDLSICKESKGTLNINTAGVIEDYLGLRKEPAGERS